MEEHRLKQICQWVYRHYPQQDGVWWIAPLLVAHPDAQHLSVTIEEAEKVFDTLEERGFVRKSPNHVALHAQRPFSAYIFNASSREALRKYCGASIYYRWLSSPWAYRIERGKYWFMIALTLIATAFFQGLFGKFGESLGDQLQHFRQENSLVSPSTTEQSDARTGPHFVDRQGPWAPHHHKPHRHGPPPEW